MIEAGSRTPLMERPPTDALILSPIDKGILGHIQILYCQATKISIPRNVKDAVLAFSQDERHRNIFAAHIDWWNKTLVDMPEVINVTVPSILMMTSSLIVSSFPPDYYFPKERNNMRRRSLANQFELLVSEEKSQMSTHQLIWNSIRPAK